MRNKAEQQRELNSIEKLIDLLYAQFDSFFCLAYKSHSDMSDSIIPKKSTRNHLPHFESEAIVLQTPLRFG